VHEDTRRRADVPQAGSRGRRWLTSLGWPAVWLVLAAVVVLPYVHSYRHLSPFDELVHLDYVVKAQHLELVNGGEKIGQVAMREQACRGHDIASMKFPECRKKHFDPNDFPEYGYNTAYPDPPLYYAVTAAGASVVEQVPGVDSVVTAARSIGVFWLAAGLMVTFLLARRLGATTLSAAGATLLLGSTPAVAHATATITSDAPAIVSGALLCLVALGVVEGRTKWWWLVVVAAAAGFVKATSLTVLGLVVLYLLMQLLTTRGPQSGRRRDVAPDVEPDPDGPGPDPAGRLAPRTVWLSVAAVTAGGLVALASWTVLSSVLSFSSVDEIPMRHAFEVSTLTWRGNIEPNLFVLLSPVQLGYIPPSWDFVNVVTVMSVLNIAVIAATTAVALLGRRGAQSTRMAAASLFAMILSGPALVLLVYVGSHTYIPIPPRYGLSMLPPVFAVLAVAASRRRGGGAVLTGLGGLALIALLVQTW
jgi:hypothetical protein